MGAGVTYSYIIVQHIIASPFCYVRAVNGVKLKHRKPQNPEAKPMPPKPPNQTL